MTGTATLDQRPHSLVRALTQRGLTLAVAESCTGGMIGAAITDVPGASACFVGGFIVYSNAMKEHVLGVRAETLSADGAVSGQCALEMAAGVAARAASDIAAAVTGIAGPDGGTVDKPVGTVWIGLAMRDQQPEARHFRFPGDRATVRAHTVDTAMAWVLASVSQTSVPVLEYERPAG